MQRKLIYFLFATICFIGCKSEPAKHTTINQETINIKDSDIPNLKGQNAFDVIHSSTIKLLDVRTHEELIEDPRIPGARNFDFRKGDFQENLEKLDKSEAYLVYCRSGGRSLEASKIMKVMGFKRVYNLEGGYTDYKSQGFLDY